MVRDFRISHRDGFWHVTILSAPHTGGETPPLDLGRCRDSKTAVRFWLACVALGARG